MNPGTSATSQQVGAAWKCSAA